MGPSGPGQHDAGEVLRLPRCAALRPDHAGQRRCGRVDRDRRRRPRCKNAELCLDPFHIVAWATKALDEVRREVWNAARKGGQKTVAKELKNARFALWKNPGDLTERQAC